LTFGQKYLINTRWPILLYEEIVILSNVLIDEHTV